MPDDVPNLPQYGDDDSWKLAHDPSRHALARTVFRHAFRAMAKKGMRRRKPKKDKSLNPKFY